MLSLDLSPAYYLVPGLLALVTPLLLRLLPSSSNSSSSSSSSSRQSQAMAASSKQQQQQQQPHTIVVLGAGYLGVPLVHHLLKHTPASVDLRVVLVSPNEAFFWNAAAPRGILPTTTDSSEPSEPSSGPGLPDDQLFFDLAPAFAASAARGGGSRRADSFEHLLGRAVRLDPDARIVDVRLLGDGGARTVRYDTAVIATGSDTRHNMPFKTVSGGGTAETRTALAGLRARIRTAKHIVVAGGGETGVEVAAELGHAYGRSGRGGKTEKEIVLVVSDGLPLAGSGSKHSVRQTAATELKKLGVRVLYNTRVVASARPTTAGEDGRTELTLATTTTTTTTTSTTIITTDVYIPALGETSNTAFLPPALVDSSAAGRNRVRTRDTLQAEGYDDVFVLGDVASLPSPSKGLTKGLKGGEDQLNVLAPQLQERLQTWASGNALPPPLRTFRPSQTVMLVLALGPDRGTGQIGPFRVPSLLVWLTKARTLGTHMAADYSAGKRTLTNTKW